MTNTSNDDEHWVTTTKKGLIGIQKLVHAIKTPVDPSEYLLEYGKVAINTQTGMFAFGDKQIQMRMSNKPYIIVRALVAATGGKVSYKELTKLLKLPNKTKGQESHSKKLIGSSIRDLRRRLGINTKEEKNNNPFIFTGKGIKLAYLPK